MALTGRSKMSDYEIRAAKQRILQYVNIMRMSQAEFCLTAGLDRRYLNNFKANLQPETRRAIEETYPALNLDWVIWGEGEMINEEYKDNQKIVIPHPKPAKAPTTSTTNSNGTITTQVGENNSGEVISTQINIPNDEDHRFTLDFFMRKLEEKDKIIAKLSEMIVELSKPCK